MATTVIACYRPKPGKRQALVDLICTHVPRLYDEGLVTRHPPFVMESMDGTVLEVFEWKSQQAIEDAHHNPQVIAMWGEFAQVCDHVPVGKLNEAGRPFSGFESLALHIPRPPLSVLFNHVQLDARIGSSGKMTAPAVVQMAQQGYLAVINLLPDSSEHALPDEAALVAESGMAYCHIPVEFSDPTLEDLDAFEAAMVAHGEDKVFVHCAANWRVSAFLSLYGQRHLGWSGRRSAEFIAQVWEPDATWQAFLDKHAVSRPHPGDH